MVAWIDPSKVELVEDGIDIAIRYHYPPNGIFTSLTQRIAALTYLFKLAKIDSRHPLKPRPLNRQERRYILHWMFKYSANKPPPDSFASNAALAEFVETSTNYKLLNHVRLSPFIGGRGLAAPTILHALIGTTTEPIFGRLEPGKAHETVNGLTFDGTFNFHHYNWGDPRKIAVEVFNRLAEDIGKRWRSIGSEVVQSKFAIDIDKAIVESYPTYWVYERVTDVGGDGRFVKTSWRIQPPSPEDHMGEAK